MKDLKQCEKHLYNLIVNEFDDFTEFVHYKVPFVVETGNYKYIDEFTGELFLKHNDCDRSRKYEMKDGILILKDGKKSSLKNVSRSLKNARKRALDNIFGYTLCNDWKYFLTLTFSPEFVDRSDDQAVKNLYSKFRIDLQTLFPDVKILAIPERHLTGELHFHCLLGGCDLDSYITKAINPHNNKVIKSNGRIVYNLNFFAYGFSTLVKMSGDKLVVANYLTKYIIKDFGNIGYNKKSFYRTRNLNFKNKKMFLFNDSTLKIDDISKSLNSAFTQKYKETDAFVIYRQYKNIKPEVVEDALMVFENNSVQLSFATDRV